MKRPGDEHVSSEQPSPKRRSLRQQKNRINEWRAQVLCDTCLKIQPAKSVGFGDTYECLNSRVLFSQPLSDVCAGINHGCQGCSFFWSMILGAAKAAVKTLGEEAVNFKVRLEKSGSYGKLELQIDGTKFDQRLEACEVSSSCVDDLLANVNDPNACQDGRNLDARLWQDKGGELACIPRAISPKILSTETRQLVSVWLEICSKHEVCSPTADQILPTRVIDVKDPQYPRLVETRGAKGQYVILSHPWGNAEGTYKTTTGQLAKHLSTIESNVLPANFQHAISLTAHLGFRYLWIDALCIVQDDRDDWKAEALQMGTYYNKSTLMISASAALNCASGFLQDRKDLYSPPFGKERLYMLRPELIQDWQLDSMPISKRAWTLQERFLAPRVLHFLPDQMLFECGCSSFSKGYFKNNVTGKQFDKRSIQNVIEPELCLQYGRNFWPDATAWSPYENEWSMCDWYDLITNFSSRAITFPSDRMPALAGLARKFAHPELGSYLAGLWEKDLFKGLCWIGSSTEASISPSRNAASGYLAPSWSWVSTNTKCNWDRDLWPFIKRGISKSQHEEYLHWRRHYSPKLVAAHVISDFGDSFTSVKEGSYLEIEGYCRDIFLFFEPTEAEPDGPNGVVLKTMHLDAPVPSDATFYFKDPPHPSKQAVLLQVCKNRGFDRAVHALLLENCGFGHYRRIGTAKLENYNLCGFLTSRSIAMVHKHPRDVDNRLEDMENEEWRLEKWQKPKIKII